MDSGFQAKAVNVVAQAFHIGEFVVRFDGAAGTSFSLPRIVYINVRLSMINQARFNHGFGIRPDFTVVNGLTPTVPTVPAHGWGQCQIIIL